MVRDQVDGGFAQQITRAHELLECVAAEIAKIDEAERAVSEHDAKRSKILGPIFGMIFERSRIASFGLAAAGQMVRQERAAGADDSQRSRLSAAADRPACGSEMTTLAADRLVCGKAADGHAVSTV